MSTRRTAQTENGPLPARDRCILVRAWHLGASWSGLGITTGRDMSVVALSRDSPASRAPPPSHPTLATLSRPLPSRVRSLVEDLLGWPSQCHLHPFAVRSLPRELYHTRGGGGSGISCASLSSSASGSVVERLSQRSIADALDRNEIGLALRCSAQIDWPVRALK